MATLPRGHILDLSILEQTTLSYIQFIENAQAKPSVMIHMDSFLLFSHLLILPTLMTQCSHTYSTMTHQPLLYFYHIYG